MTLMKSKQPELHQCRVTFYLATLCYELWIVLTGIMGCID